MKKIMLLVAALFFIAFSTYAMAASGHSAYSAGDDDADDRTIRSAEETFDSASKGGVLWGDAQEKMGNMFDNAQESIFGRDDDSSSSNNNSRSRDSDEE